jgi:hypothetical protein
VIKQTYQYTLSFSAWVGGFYAHTEYWAAWIDFNQNGSFDDTGEQIMTMNSTSTGTLSATFRVPAAAKLGKVRMRVSMKWGSSQYSCETFPYGEVEDYFVNIADLSGRTYAREATNPDESDKAEITVEPNGINLYPNPVSHVLTLTGINSVSQLSIIDMMGHEVYTGVGKEEIDVSPLPAGMYLLTVTGENKKVLKFVKQ